MKKLGFLAAAFFFAAAAFGQSISAPDAMQRALALTGGGNVSNLELVTEGGAPVYRIVIVNNGVNFAVSINGNTGAVMSLVSGQPQTAPQVAPQTAPVPQFASPSPQFASPSPQAGGGWPANPAISLERAIQIGYAELARRGLAGSFRNHSGMDFERGQWVWEVVFAVPGGWLPLVEMYINVHNGNIVKFEWDD